MVKEEGTLDQMARRLEAGVATTNNTGIVWNRSNKILTAIVCVDNHPQLNGKVRKFLQSL
jgi:hypothetical protein